MSKSLTSLLIKVGKMTGLFQEKSTLGKGGGSDLFKRVTPMKLLCFYQGTTTKIEIPVAHSIYFLLEGCREAFSQKIFSSHFWPKAIVT